MARILIVDDEPAWRDLCRDRLAELGHVVLAVNAGRKVLELVVVERPDLMVLDLRMPMSGRSILRAARRRRPDLPVIIHTAYGGYEDDPDLAFAEGFVVKSPDLKDLVSAVNAALGVSRKK